MSSNRIRISTLCRTLFVLLAGSGPAAAEWIPADRPLPERPPLLKRGDIEVIAPEAGTFRPADFEKSRSLAGDWKFSGLKSSGTAFLPATPEELRFAAPEFDDSGWGRMPVPLNWYRTPATDYSKVLKTGNDIDPASAGGADWKSVVNPYFKGWYRHQIELPEPLPPGRIQLEFDAIGYEAELFVNGKPAGRHHGDFVPFTADITALAGPGKNLIALRVLSDFRPKDEKFTRTYGAMWNHTCFKGGIWLPVRLLFRPEPRIDRIRLTTDPSNGDLRLDYELFHPGRTPVELTPGVAVTPAEAGTPPTPAREFTPVTLQPGVNTGTLHLRVQNPKLWSPDTPDLYYATLHFRSGKDILSARTERFGFRDFKTDGTGFRLNGKPIYLFFESAHSIRFGGYPTPDGNSSNPRAMLEGFRKKGYNMLRTAHMPISPEVLDLADELGMMIYDEWSFVFITGLNEPVFEANNLPELKQFILRDYNHPSVVMWSLGNEVPHRRDPGLVRQLNKQTALVRELDLQKRPICAFSGIGNVDSYGRTKLDTDVIDLHLYTGINELWTQWNRHFQLYYQWCSDIYGDGKSYDKPTIISECVGGGWGMTSDPSFKLGDIDRYLELIKRPYTWGNPGAAGYSGSIGVAATLDPKRGYRYLQNRLGSRLLELIRREPRIAGFAPWFADHTMKNATGWNQQLYPGLRIPGRDGVAPRQLLTPGKLELEAFLLNRNSPPPANPRLVIELAADNRVFPLAELRFDPVANAEGAVKPLTLTLPETGSGSGELRLTLYDSDHEIGRNGYTVTLHAVAAATAPVANPLPVALLMPDAETETILQDLKIPYQHVKSPQKLADFKRALLPLKREWQSGYGAELQSWVKNGGMLLMLEPDHIALPGFPEYDVIQAPNSLVEAVIPNHPVFRNLTPDDLDVWAENPNALVTESVLIPLNATALAVKGALFSDKSVGAAVAEATSGKGRIFISTLNASRLWKKNAAATGYLRNLFDYFASADAVPAPARALESRRQQLHFSPDPARVLTLDLRAQVTCDFADDRSDDGKGGWTDQGPNNFSMIPKGRQTACNVPFDIIDPAANRGKGCIPLRGKERPGFPEAVTGIPVGAKVSALYFLHTAAWVSSPGECGRYRIGYADGTAEDYFLMAESNINDWWKTYPMAEALPAFTLDNPAGGKVTLFVARWNNPRPDREVASIDFLAARDSSASPVPILVAVTAERTAEKPAILLPASAAAPRWGVGSERDGAPATAQMVRRANPAGEWSTRLRFPANVNNSVPYALLHYSPEQLKNGPFRFISFLLKSDTGGAIDFVLPETQWHSTMAAHFNLAAAKGRWVRVRLDLEKDFEFTGGKFSQSQLRPEVALYNGKHQAGGYPRKAAEFEITDIRFE